MAGLSQLWDHLVNCVCRPPRDQYGVHDLLGGNGGHFVIGTCAGRREDFKLTNTRGKRLECSRFLNINTPPSKPVPTVIYCHCNSGSRRDSEEAVYRLLPDGIVVVSLDFEGSGLSEGDYVTLGANEVDDLQVVIQHLRENNLASTIGCWGRSMGAVTALLCSQRDPSIAGIVCDSPFSRLKDLMLELVEEQKLPIPRMLQKTVLGFMRRSVKNRAGFDIYEVSPLDKVQEAFVPALFGHAEGDTFVMKHHSERLHQQYAGEKNLITFDGDHNSPRPTFFYTSVVIFFHNVLQIDLGSLRESVNYSALPPKHRGGAVAAALQGWGYYEAGGFAILNTQGEDGISQGDDADVNQRGLDIPTPHHSEEFSIFSPLPGRDVEGSSWLGTTSSGAEDGQANGPAGGFYGDEDMNDPLLQEILRISLGEARGAALQHAEAAKPAAREEAAQDGGTPLESLGAQSAQPATEEAEAAMIAQAIAASLAAEPSPLLPKLTIPERVAELHSPAAEDELQPNQPAETPAASMDESPSMQGHEAGAQPRAARAEESTAESSASRGKANSERELEELREQAAFLAQSAPLDKPSGKDP